MKTDDPAFGWTKDPITTGRTMATTFPDEAKALAEVITGTFGEIRAAEIERAHRMTGGDETVEPPEAAEGAPPAPKEAERPAEEAAPESTGTDLVPAGPRTTPRGRRRKSHPPLEKRPRGRPRKVVAQDA